MREEKAGKWMIGSICATKVALSVKKVGGMSLLGYF